MPHVPAPRLAGYDASLEVKPVDLVSRRIKTLMFSGPDGSKRRMCTVQLRFKGQCVSCRIGRLSDLFLDGKLGVVFVVLCLCMYLAIFGRQERWLMKWYLDREHVKGIGWGGSLARVL